ncbi:MAG: GNAT family N-acetyltransferase [Hyphomicrobiaceae bacterium]|nr:GNAT family N-acetyltransferase [Hyphomicrobiaceae bacterium]
MDDEADEFKRGRESVPSDNGCLLTTSQLILRPPRIDDAEAVAAIANNLKIAEQTRRMPYPYRVEDAHNWIASLPDSQECAFVIARKCDNAIVGASGLGVGDTGEHEVGYWIGEPFWGNGYATEAARAVIDYAFANLSISLLNSRCRVVNEASRRVLVKCGFQLVGTGMSMGRAYGGPVPVDEFVLERSVWESLKQWGAA